MKNSIALIWMPGCGKSTIWLELHKELSKYFDINFKDFDNDILEKITLEQAEELLWILKLRSFWLTPENLSNQTVSHILNILWDNNFLRLEWLIWEKLNFKKPTILSTSWSLPLNPKAMRNIRKQAKVIHINPKLETILKRINTMKTDRIIWSSKWISYEEIFNYRNSYYEISRDYEFIPNSKWHIETTDKKIISEQQNEIFKQFINFIKNDIKAKIIL